MKKEDLEEKLKTFTDTDQYHEHEIGRASIRYTDGVKYVSDKSGSYRLLDEILLGQIKPKINLEPFQIWRLTVKDNRAVLLVTDGKKRKIFQKKFAFPDFPIGQIEFYYTNGIVMLASEY